MSTGRIASSKIYLKGKGTDYEKVNMFVLQVYREKD
jgi:hypothetical protein